MNRRILFLAVAQTLAMGAHGASILVDEAGDDSAGMGCNLRDAIESANTNGSTDCVPGTVGLDTITFDAALLPGTVTLGAAPPSLTESAMIEGPGAAMLTIDLAGNYGFEGTGITASFSSLTLINGARPSNTGGALRMTSGDLTLIDVVLSGNAANSGGAIRLTDSDLTVSGSTISDNASTFGAGAIYATGTGAMVITQSVLSGNLAGSNGGAINSLGVDLSLDDVMLIDNLAGQSGTGNPINDRGGAVQIRTASLIGSSVTVTGSNGSAIYSRDGSVHLTDSILSGNEGGQGAALRVYDSEFYGARLTLENNKALVTNGGSGGGAIHHAQPSGNMPPSGFTLIDSTLSGNEALTGTQQKGGALMLVNPSATLTNVTLTSNSANFFGGGFYVSGGTATLDGLDASGNDAADGGAGVSQRATITITNSRISTNTASRDGGGVRLGYGSSTVSSSRFDGNTAGRFGGGLRVFVPDDATLENVTLSSNHADAGGGLSFSGSASTISLTNSAIYGNLADSAGGGIASSGTLSLENASVAGNVAPQGAGVAAQFGEATLRHITLANNVASAGAVVELSNNAVLTFSNSVVDSVGMACLASPGQFQFAGVNHFSDASCDGVASGDALLTELAANGGPTPSNHPRGGSPVIDAASFGFCLPTDQRGETRPTSPCDLGAVEVVGENAPPRIDDQRLLGLTPLMPGQGVGFLAFSDPDESLPAGSASIISGDPQFGLTVDGEVFLDSLAPVAGEFLLDVEVRDSEGLGDRAIVTVSLEDPEPPALGDASFTVPTDITIPHVVGTVTATDANGDLKATGAYSIIAGDDAARFAIDDAGQITLTSDENLIGTVILTVQAEDQSGLTDTAQVTVNLPAAMAPELADASFSVPTGISLPHVLGTVTATDPNNDLQATGTYSIIAGDDAARFAIDDAGQITLTSDENLAGTAILTVQAEDQSGLTGIATVTVRLGDVILITGFED